MVWCGCFPVAGRGCNPDGDGGGLGGEGRGHDARAAVDDGDSFLSAGLGFARAAGWEGWVVVVVVG